jgi:predicted N-acetyltransferase YhbS
MTLLHFLHNQHIFYGIPPELVLVSPTYTRYPIPVMILARLAVDTRFHGQKLGQGLLLDALRRTVNAADIAGIRAILVHAQDESAGKFYGHFGFEPFPASPLTMYKLLKDIRSIMG